MKYFKVIIIGLLTTLFSCNKIKKIKNNLDTVDLYKKSNIDRFYWEDSGYDYEVLPVLKPFKLINLQGNSEWILNSSEMPDEINDISPVASINLYNNKIYGFQDNQYQLNSNEVRIPARWFIIDTQAKKISYFEKETEFKAALKRHNLPEKFLNPDEVYEEFKQDPVLEWFPQNIKKQLNEVKSSLKNK